MNYVSYFLLLMFAILAITHLVYAFFHIFMKKSGYSYIPFVNGVIGALGFYLNSDERLSTLWWLPFLLDWGCIPMIFEGVRFRFQGI